MKVDMPENKENKTKTITQTRNSFVNVTCSVSFFLLHFSCCPILKSFKIYRVEKVKKI